MTRPTPHSLLPEPDAFALVALGLVSVLERFDGWLDRASDGYAPPLDDGDATLLAALGLVSLRQTAGRWLELAGALPAVPAAPAGRAARAGLLR